MLESMTGAPRPTRAEATDVANAILDGSDVVMLSGETAGGDYPLESCGVMARICFEAERMINREALLSNLAKNAPTASSDQAIASSAVTSATELGAKLIIAFSEDGALARRVSQYRPACKVIVASTDNWVLKSTNISRGLYGYKLPSADDQEAMLSKLVEHFKETEGLKAGDQLVAVWGETLKTLTVE